jgi:hypothetical protein
MVDVFRLTARGVDVSREERAWVQDELAKRTQWSYIRGAVRREVRPGLPDVRFADVAIQKLEEIWHVLTDKRVEVNVDEVVEMYM